MLHTRRDWIAGAAGLFATASLGTPALALQPATPGRPTRLILLGTKGGPPLARSGRMNTATLILVDDVPFLVDCGYGVARQLVAVGVDPGRVGHIFLTHHHSDHTLEYGPLLYQAWLSPRRPAINVYAPPGIAAITDAFFAYQALDIAIRIEDEGMTDPRSMVTTHDIRADGLVLDHPKVRVTCCRVRHPPIDDSFAFRFDTADRSIVVSGDTAYSPELVALAKGADVLVHEALYLPGVDRIVARATNAPRLRQHIIASHTSTEEAGRVAAEADVKLLVLSHLIPGDDPSISEEQWLEGVRKHYAGPAIVGRDLQEI